MGRGQRRHGLRPAGCDKAKRVNGATSGIKTNEERQRSSFVLIDKAHSKKVKRSAGIVRAAWVAKSVLYQLDY